MLIWVSHGPGSVQGQLCMFTRHQLFFGYTLDGLMVAQLLTELPEVRDVVRGDA